MLYTGTRVLLKGLEKRQDLNGSVGRVLKFETKAQRYGVRVAGVPNILALKRANLDPMPLFGMELEGGDTAAAAGSGGSQIQWLLDLPADALESLMSHLSVRALHRLSLTCTTLHAATKACDESIWRVHLSHPALAPYHTTPHRAGPQQPPSPRYDVDAYRQALRMRDAWHRDFGKPNASDTGGACCRDVFTYDRFVRSVDVDADSLPSYTCAAVGLSSGAVAVAAVPKPSQRQQEDLMSLMAALSSTEVESLEGEAHEEQVLAVALHAASGVVVSGCGRPSYPVAYPRTPYSPTLKVWALDDSPLSPANMPAAHWGGAPTWEGTLRHTLEGHEDAIKAVMLLDAHRSPRPLHAASSSLDGTVRVWQLDEGRLVRTLDVRAALDGCRTAEGVRLSAAEAATRGGRLEGEYVVNMWHATEPPRQAHPHASGAGDDDDRILCITSCLSFIEFRWRTGQVTRAAREASGETIFGSITAASYHAPTRTLAVFESEGGLRGGGLDLLQVRDADARSRHTHAAEAPHAPLGPLLGARLIIEADDPVDEGVEIVAIQHDGDKIVWVGRHGWLCCGRVRVVSSSDRTTRSRDALDDAYTFEPDAGPSEQFFPRMKREKARTGSTGDGVDVGVELRIVCEWKKRVRYYVSSVVCRGGVLAHDGLDNMLSLTSASVL